MYMTDSLMGALVIISVLYFALLLIKNIARNKEFCVLCLSVSLTWISLLILMFLGQFYDKTLLALLMGQSITGIFYLAENRAKEELKIFRLPFILTLTFLAYHILSPSKNIISTGVFLIGIWGVFSTIYFLRSSRKIKEIAIKVIECCKNW